MGRAGDDGQFLLAVHPVKGVAIEVKHLKGPSIADCERILAHNKPKADALGLGNALVVKRAAGRGRPSPFLAIFPLTAEESASA